MSLGEGSTRGGHGVGPAGLVAQYKVQLPFHEDGEVVLADSLYKEFSVLDYNQLVHEAEIV